MDSHKEEGKTNRYISKTFTLEDVVHKIVLSQMKNSTIEETRKNGVQT